MSSRHPNPSNPTGVQRPSRRHVPLRLMDIRSAGLGVALVRRLHAEEALEAGRLVRISATEVKTPYRCYLVWRDDNPRVAQIRRFADWILAEFGRAGLLEAA